MKNLMTTKNGGLSTELSLPTFNNWFDEFFNDKLITNPSFNVLDTDKDFLIEVASPGFDKSDFKIDVDENTLTILAESQNNNYDETKTYKRREFSYSSFKRTFTIPKDVDQDNISAKYENGILNISMPKIEVKGNPNKRILIQ